MSSSDVVRISKFLSLVLRHKPETIGLILDEKGWADVDDLIHRCNEAGRPLNRAQLEHVVAENDKRRFLFSEDGLRIRANQGHSIEVDLALPPRTPPDLLHHGTATRFLEPIRAQRLHSGNRQHVHLSLDPATATNVGRRHGHPVVLVVQAGAMHAAGHEFYLSENGVWLTPQVPVDYLEFPESSPIE